MIRNRYRVAVVGVGVIGARHVQAMAGVTVPIDLDIVDPVPEARVRANTFLDAMGGLVDGQVREFSRIEDLAAAPDLAIVATASRERASAVTALVAAGAQKLILEKVLFTRLSDYDSIDALLATTDVRAWVNCPRRSYPRARRLLDLIDGARFDYRVEGRGWGLACNLVHHLDEFANLCGQAEVTLDTSALDESVVSAKRVGYIEFFGKISGETAMLNRFDAICSEGPASGRTVSIQTEDVCLTISPEQKLMILRDGRTSIEPYPMPPQSQMTANHVLAILTGQKLGLPPYAAASRLHRKMIGAFIEHLRRVGQNDSIDECPVT